MTIFYEKEGLIISDTGVLFEGKKISLTRITSWKMWWREGTGLGDVLLVYKCFPSFIPSFINWTTLSIFLTNASVADDAFEAWSEQHAGCLDKTGETFEADFKARVSELKLVTRALDLMMASKQ